MAKKFNPQDIADSYELGDNPLFAKPKKAKYKQDKVVDKPIDNNIDQSTNQSSNLSTNSIVDDTIDILDDVMTRPKAFYITKRQDRNIDRLVEKINDRYNLKLKVGIDRSLVVRLLLEDVNLLDDLLADRLTDRLKEYLRKQMGL